MADDKHKTKAAILNELESIKNLLVEEAGGRFANFSGNKDSIRAGDAIVGNSTMVRKVRKMIQELKKPAG